MKQIWPPLEPKLPALGIDGTVSNEEFSCGHLSMLADLGQNWTPNGTIINSEDMDSVNQNVPINNRPLNKSQNFRM